MGKLGNIRVIVTGAEHSGTRFVWGLLSVHPDLKPFHVSIPSEGKLKPLSDADIVVYVVRDKTCTLRSQEQGNSVKEEHLIQCNAKDSVEMADNYFYGEMEKTNKPYILISYETLLRHKSAYLRQIFRSMGISEDYDYDFEGWVDVGYGDISTTPVDGNKKYIT